MTVNKKSKQFIQDPQKSERQIEDDRKDKLFLVNKIIVNACGGELKSIKRKKLFD